MALAMPGQERDAMACEQADPYRPRRRAVSRDRLVRFDILQVGKLVQPGTANDG